MRNPDDHAGSDLPSGRREATPTTPDAANGAANELSDAGSARRRFIVGSGALTGGIAAARYATAAPAPRTGAASTGVAGTRPVALSVNARDYVVAIEPRVTLLDALRESLGLTGTKKGCDRGQCGACTVLVNGRRVNSCLTLAMSCEGDKITTVEGLGDGEALHAMQQAFITNDGFQCGYCTPGQLCSAVALMSELRAGDASAVTRDIAKTGPADVSDDELRERMSGNICRCGAYAGIVAALRQVIDHG